VTTCVFSPFFSYDTDWVNDGYHGGKGNNGGCFENEVLIPSKYGTSANMGV